MVETEGVTLKTRHCIGFLFNEGPDFSRVVLIRRNLPDGRVGKLNGVGGQVMDGESPVEAMRHEFKEACGVEKKDWVLFAVKTTPEVEVYCFAATDGLLIDGAIRTMTDEEVVVVHTRLPWRSHGRVNDLSVLVAMAQEKLSDDVTPVLALSYFL